MKDHRREKMYQLSKEQIQAISSRADHLPFLSLSLLICQVDETLRSCHPHRTQKGSNGLIRMRGFPESKAMSQIGTADTGQLGERSHMTL